VKKKSESAAKQTHGYQLCGFMSTNFQRGSTADMLSFMALEMAPWIQGNVTD
jgi:hypothetical protein